jgi:hypothetical protein
MPKSAGLLKDMTNGIAVRYPSLPNRQRLGAASEAETEQIA